MKIGGWQKVSLIDYPGMVATVVFTAGCNFRCRYCHNAKLLDGRGVAEINMSEWWGWLENRRGKLDAVVISGGEPTLQTDLVEFTEKIKKMGYKVKLDSNGTNPNMLKKLIERQLLDYIAMDIKAPLDKYHKITGINFDTEKIKKSINLIIRSNIDHEFRTTYVDKLLSVGDLMEIVKMIKGAKRYYIQDFVYSEDVYDHSLVNNKGVDFDSRWPLLSDSLKINWR